MSAGWVTLKAQQLRLCVRVECHSVVTLSVDTVAAEKNKYCKVPGPGKQLPEASSAYKRGRSILIPMPAQTTVASAWQFLSLARVYSLGFPTLNPALYYIPSQREDQDKLKKKKKVQHASSTNNKFSLIL